jgi:nicotinamide riboside transporter PnuC
VIVIVVVITVVVVVTVAALATRVFQLLAALLGLLAVLAVALNCVAQFFFGLVNASFAALVGAGRNGGSHEANDGQQGNRKHLLSMGHLFLL